VSSLNRRYCNVEVVQFSYLRDPEVRKFTRFFLVHRYIRGKIFAKIRSAVFLRKVADTQTDYQRALHNVLGGQTEYQLPSTSYANSCVLVWNLLPDNFTIFTALHCMQGGLSYERLSVCLSVKCVNCDKTKAPSEKVQL